MVDPYLALDSIATKLRAISGLVTLLGGATANIATHKTGLASKNLAEAIAEMPIPGALVYHKGTVATTGQGNRSAYEHQFGIAVRSGTGGFGAVLAALANGTPTGSSAKFPSCEIHAGLTDIGAVDANLTQQITDPATMSYIEYYEITFSMKERG